MKTTSVAICLLLTALAALPVASAADPVPDVCETARCEVSDPPADCSVQPTYCKVDGVAACGVLSVGVSCGHYLSDCLMVLWGIHQPGLVVGGYNTCNVVVWTDLGAVSVTDSAAVAAPCDVSPTWPSGHAVCTVAGRTVGCSTYTGATLLQDPDRYACGVTGCGTGGFHADGALVSFGTQGCIVYVLVDAGGLDPVLDLLNELIHVDPVATGAAAPCSLQGEVGCSTPAGSCYVFLNRWSYGDCETVAACMDELSLEWGRLSAYANTCEAGFYLQG